MNMDQIEGIVRHILTVAGTALVAKGVIDASTLAAAAGALATLVAVGWSVWAKRKPKPSV